MAALELSSSRHGDRTVLRVSGELDIISRTELITCLDKVRRSSDGAGMLRERFRCSVTLSGNHLS